MSVDLRDLPRVFRDAGVPYVEEDGWQSRGRPGSFEPRGLMLHHDASPAGETSNGVDVIRDGRPGLEGPLAQLWLDFDGVWHIVAAGRASHAGEGDWIGIPPDTGNTYFVGVETDHTTNERWSDKQRPSGLRGILALCDWLDIRDSADDLFEHLCAHKEYAPTRKVDPDPLDMDDLRALILNPPDLEDGPVLRISKGNDEEQRLASNEWNRLRLTSKDEDDTGLWAVAPGPASWWNLTVHYTVKGEVNRQVSLRAYREDGDGVRSVVYDMVTDPIPNGGILRAGYSAQGSLEHGEWLRVEARCNADAVIDQVTTRCSMWE